MFHLLSTQRKEADKESLKNAKRKRRNENCIFQITQVVLSFSVNDHNHSTTSTCYDCSKKHKSSKACSSSLSTVRSSESESRVILFLYCLTFLYLTGCATDAVAFDLDETECSLTALELIRTLSFEKSEVLHSFYGNEFPLRNGGLLSQTSLSYNFPINEVFFPLI